LGLLTTGGEEFSCLGAQEGWQPSSVVREIGHFSGGHSFWVFFARGFGLSGAKGVSGGGGETKVYSSPLARFSLVLKRERKKKKNWRCLLERPGTKTLTKNGVLDESVRLTTEHRIETLFWCSYEQRVWVTSSFVLEESCSLYAYPMGRHLN